MFVVGSFPVYLKWNGKDAFLHGHSCSQLYKDTFGLQCFMSHCISDQ